MDTIQPQQIQTFYMDGYLRSNMQTAKRVVKKDWDFVFIIDGKERGGKSVLAMQMAYDSDSTFCLERVAFTAEEFKRAVHKASKYQAVVYDEAFTGLLGKNTMSGVNKALVEMLAEIGQKNLFIFVVMPSFFDLDKYVALHRSVALLHVYTGDDFERGFFAFYNADKKKELYIYGKKTYSYAMPRPNFVGRFTNYYVVDEAKYRSMKAKSLSDKEEGRKDIDEAKLDQLVFEKVLTNAPDISHATKMKVLGMPESTYFLKKKQFERNRALLQGNEALNNKQQT